MTHYSPYQSDEVMDHILCSNFILYMEVQIPLSIPLWNLFFLLEAIVFIYFTVSQDQSISISKQLTVFMCDKNLFEFNQWF